LVPTFGIIRQYAKTADRYHSFEATENRRKGSTFSKIYRIQAVQQLSVQERVLRNAFKYPEPAAAVGINSNS
jgi:hypothetical protein